MSATAFTSPTVSPVNCKIGTKTHKAKNVEKAEIFRERLRERGERKDWKPALIVVHLCSEAMMRVAGTVHLVQKSSVSPFHGPILHGFTR